MESIVATFTWFSFLPAEKNTYALSEFFSTPLILLGVVLENYLKELVKVS